MRNGDEEEKNHTGNSRVLWSVWDRAASNKELGRVDEDVRGVK